MLDLISRRVSTKFFPLFLTGVAAPGKRLFQRDIVVVGFPKNDAPMKRFSIVGEVQIFCQLHTLSIKCLYDVLFAFPSGNALGGNFADVDHSVLTKTILNHNRAIETDEYSVRGLGDLEILTRLEKHLHKAAFALP